MKFIELLGCWYQYLSSDWRSCQPLHLQIFAYPFLFLRFPWCVCWFTWWCPTHTLCSVCFSSIFFSFCSEEVIISFMLASSSLIFFLLTVQITYLVYTLFSWLSLCLPSLSMFKTVVLKYSSINSTSRSFWKTIFVDLFFFPLNGPYFPVSLHVLWLFVRKLDIWI